MKYFLNFVFVYTNNNNQRCRKYEYKYCALKFSVYKYKYFASSTSKKYMTHTAKVSEGGHFFITKNLLQISSSLNFQYFKPFI